MVMSDRWRMSLGLRRASAAVAVMALAIGGAKVTSDHTMPGSGFSTVQTAAADPTGPTGGPSGGPGGMNGSQFQPPGLPPQMPDYQGGINQPPLDQNSGISIYNSGNPQAPQQVPGQQAGQQPQQAQQPANGTQIPDYQSNPGYTQGPGQPNPNYQAPQQQSPQQAQQPQQPQQQQPSQAQQPEKPENEQNEDQQDDQKMRCLATLIGGGGGLFSGPGSDPIFQASGNCRDCDKETPKQFSRNCDEYTYKASAGDVTLMPCGYIYDPDSKVTPKDKDTLHDYCSYSPDNWGIVDFAPACARHDMCYEIAESKGEGFGPCNSLLGSDLHKACDLAYGDDMGWVIQRKTCEITADVYQGVVTGAHPFSN